MTTFRARFIPRYPEKYLGNPGNILARSSWELHVMKYFDITQAVVKWGSEEFSIPYIKPTDGKVHNYFPDFIVVYRDKAGNLQKEIIEVKPLKETLLQNAKSDHDKIALAINAAKWRAAQIFANNNGMRFRVLTEQSLFNQSKVKQAKQPKVARKPRGTRQQRSKEF